MIGKAVILNTSPVYLIFSKNCRAALPCRILLLSLLAGLLFSDGEGISLLPLGGSSSPQAVVEAPTVLPDQIVANGSGAAKQSKSKERDSFQFAGSEASVSWPELRAQVIERSFPTVEVRFDNTEPGRSINGRAPPRFDSRTL